ncbi:MAG TPA: MBL fold metallo-hydrolase [Gammaproteobacteria bacterium]|nr:MBL fold metallo-hydrolase [Gammaproteobacteria bacterium]
MRYCLLAVGAIAAAAITSVEAQPTASRTPEELVAAAKRAAGRDYAGTFLRICVAPDNLNAAQRPPPLTGPSAVPDRATWYAAPYKVFDNLYFVGTQVHSAWALTTADGIIVIDTLFDYAIEPEIVAGLTTLGLEPRDIKYVLISHAHGDHDQGAALLQRRYGAMVVMGAADWETTLQRPADARGGVPTRDVSVGPEGIKITLGGTTVDVIATPGHTRGTLSYIFPVRDRGRTLMVAYAGGTAFNFPREAGNFAIYRDSQNKMLEAARAAGATVLMSNHTEFDRAYDRVRIAQLPRAPGEKHPYETDAATVQRYFEMGGLCAEAERLRVASAN